MKDSSRPVPLCASQSSLPLASSAESTREMCVAAGAVSSFPAGKEVDEPRHEQATVFGCYDSPARRKVLRFVGLLQSELSSKKKGASKDVFSGADVVAILRDQFCLAKQSASHLLYLLHSLGFIVNQVTPTQRHSDDRLIADKFRYRFQIFEYWPLRLEQNTDEEYGCYLYRVHDLSARSPLMPYELEALDILQRHLESRWTDIQKKALQRRLFLKTLSGEERHAYYLYERKFWRVVRPPPLCPCPLAHASHPWLEKDSHGELLERTKAKDMDRISCDSRASSHDGSLASDERRRSRSTGSKEMLQGRRKFRIGPDSASLPAIALSRVSADLSASMSVEQMERNALWLSSIQNPSGTRLSGKTPTLAAITGRKDLQSVTESAQESADASVPSLGGAAAGGAAAGGAAAGGATDENRALQPPVAHSPAASSSEPAIMRSASRQSSGCSGFSSGNALGAMTSSSPCDTPARSRPVSVTDADSGLYPHHSTCSSSASHIAPLTSETLLENEVHRLVADLHQPYLPAMRLISVNAKYMEERRDLDMILGGSTSGQQNVWTGGYADPAAAWEGIYITPHQLRLWAISFEALLHDPRGRLEFETFLEREFAAENIAFWKEAQVYRNLPSSLLQERAEMLYKEFVMQNCPMQINIPAGVHVEIRKHLESGPTRFMFDVALWQVYHLMRKDSYPRFLQSAQFKDLQTVLPTRTPVNILRSLRIRRSSVSPSGGGGSSRPSMVSMGGRDHVASGHVGKKWGSPPEGGKSGFGFGKLASSMSSDQIPSSHRHVYQGGSNVADILSHPTGVAKHQSAPLDMPATQASINESKRLSPSSSPRTNSEPSFGTKTSAESVRERPYDGSSGTSNAARVSLIGGVPSESSRANISVASTTMGGVSESSSQDAVLPCENGDSRRLYSIPRQSLMSTDIFLDPKATPLSGCNESITTFTDLNSVVSIVSRPSQDNIDEESGTATTQSQAAPTLALINMDNDKVQLAGSASGSENVSPAPSSAQLATAPAGVVAAAAGVCGALDGPRTRSEDLTPPGTPTIASPTLLHADGVFALDGGMEVLAGDRASLTSAGSAGSRPSSPVLCVSPPTAAPQSPSPGHSHQRHHSSCGELGRLPLPSDESVSPDGSKTEPSKRVPSAFSFLASRLQRQAVNRSSRSVSANDLYAGLTAAEGAELRHIGGGGTGSQHADWRTRQAAAGSNGGEAGTAAGEESLASAAKLGGSAEHLERRKSTSKRLRMRIFGS